MISIVMRAQNQVQTYGYVVEYTADYDVVAAQWRDGQLVLFSCTYPYNTYIRIRIVIFWQIGLADLCS